MTTNKRYMHLTIEITEDELVDGQFSLIDEYFDIKQMFVFEGSRRGKGGAMLHASVLTSSLNE